MGLLAVRIDLDDAPRDRLCLAWVVCETGGERLARACEQAAQAHALRLAVDALDLGAQIARVQRDRAAQVARGDGALKLAEIDAHAIGDAKRVRRRRDQVEADDGVDLVERMAQALAAALAVAVGPQLRREDIARVRSRTHRERADERALLARGDGALLAIDEDVQGAEQAHLNVGHRRTLACCSQGRGSVARMVTEIRTSATRERLKLTDVGDTGVS